MLKYLGDTSISHKRKRPGIRTKHVEVRVDAQRQLGLLREVGHVLPVHAPEPGPMLVVDPLVPAVAPQFIIDLPILVLFCNCREHRGRPNRFALDPEDLVAVADRAVEIDGVAQAPKLVVPGLVSSDVEEEARFR